MAKTYKQFSLTERIELYRMHREGRSMRAIAIALGRSPSTISRELERNSRKTKSWSGGYQPVRAEALRQRRRGWDARGPKISSWAIFMELRTSTISVGWK